MPTITIPVKKITLIKASVLAGIVASYLVPPQYAVAVAFVPNAYWMFKL